MEAWVMAKESELEEKKKMLSESKAKAKCAEDLVVAFIEGGADNVDEETMKGLIEKAMRNVTDVLKETQTLRSGDGNIGGRNEGSSDDHNLDIGNEAVGSDGGKKDDVNGGDHHSE